MTRSFLLSGFVGYVSTSLIAFFALVSGSVAQTNYGNAGETAQAVQPVHYTTPFSYGHYHASTAAEGYLRGKAAVIDAIGSFQINDAQAQILREHARALDRDNDLKQTEALHRQKKMWSDARVNARKDRLIRAAEGQQLLSERRATVYGAAYRLSPAELNLQTGAISWPEALCDGKFQTNREQVDELFRELVGYGGAQPAKAVEVARSVDAFSKVLKSEIATMPRDEYLAAQKFLLGLKYAAGSVG
jgi:hypothetical protein